MEGAFAAVRAVIYATGFVLLWSWLAVKARALDQVLGLELPSVPRVPGGFLAAAGGLLALSCIVAFVVEGRGIPALFDAPLGAGEAAPAPVTRSVGLPYPPVPRKGRTDP